MGISVGPVVIFLRRGLAFGEHTNNRRTQTIICGDLLIILGLPVYYYLNKTRKNYSRMKNVRTKRWIEEAGRNADRR